MIYRLLECNSPTWGFHHLASAPYAAPSRLLYPSQLPLATILISTPCRQGFILRTRVRTCCICLSASGLFHLAYSPPDHVNQTLWNCYKLFLVLCLGMTQNVVTLFPQSTLLVVLLLFPFFFYSFGGLSPSSQINHNQRLILLINTHPYLGLFLAKFP